MHLSVKCTLYHMTFLSSISTVPSQISPTCRLLHIQTFSISSAEGYAFARLGIHDALNFDERVSPTCQKTCKPTLTLHTSNGEIQSVSISCGAKSNVRVALRYLAETVNCKLLNLDRYHCFDPLPSAASYAHPVVHNHDICKICLFSGARFACVNMIICFWLFSHRRQTSLMTMPVGLGLRLCRAFSCLPERFAYKYLHKYT